MAERARVLIVDDDRAVVTYLNEVLAPRYNVVVETSSPAALDRVRSDHFDVVVSDVEMPDLRGPDLLAAILQIKPRQPVVLITAFSSVELAVASVRAGACDFVTKPFKADALVAAIDGALRDRTVPQPDDEDTGLIARSAGMVRAFDLARRAARSDVPVLISGESGTGKGALAHWIHERSARRDGPLVHINCAAVPPRLIADARPGLFDEASRGTLFLDEITELPNDAQAKLLQLLEPTRGHTDVRVITATNRDLDAAVRLGRFRSDLYFRINVVRIDVPALRSRREDIPALVEAFLARSSRRGRPPLGITQEAIDWLCKQDWHGNVRELSNVIERAVAITEHDALVIDDVRDRQYIAPEDDGFNLVQAATRELPLARVELAYIRQVIASVGGNMVHAARVLGIDRRTLYRKLGGPA